jgi:hypothetical protein
MFSTVNKTALGLWMLSVMACATPQKVRIATTPGHAIQVPPQTADGIVAVPAGMTACLIQDQQVRALAGCTRPGGCNMPMPFQSAATGSANPMTLGILPTGVISNDMSAVLGHICVSCVECCPGGGQPIRPNGPPLPPLNHR